MPSPLGSAWHARGQTTESAPLCRSVTQRRQQHPRRRELADGQTVGRLPAPAEKMRQTQLIDPPHLEVVGLTVHALQTPSPRVPPVQEMHQRHPRPPRRG